MRKTVLDDCKGDKLQECLASFSAVVVRKVLASGSDGKASIAARLATAKRVTPNEHASFIPLAIAHRAALTALLRKKRDLKARYQSFNDVLDKKEQELGRRFEAVVQTQDVLDTKTIPDHAVSRVSKAFEQNWLGDTRLVDLILQNAGQETNDSLLDGSFPKLWSEVSKGSFCAPTTSGYHMHLDDLEKRVADQDTRLKEWRDFKQAIEKNRRPTMHGQSQSPTIAKSKTKTANFQKQREIVFSPRKSPRKSILASSRLNDTLNPVDPTSACDCSTDLRSFSSLTIEDENKPKEQCITAHSDRISLFQPSRTQVDQNPNDESSYGNLISDSAIGSDDNENSLLKPNHSMIHDGTPTPAGPKLSLVERTRQSILGSVNTDSSQTISSPSLPRSPMKEASQSSTNQSSGPATLLERTRKSMSTVPPQIKASCKSLNDRRVSKIYPTNQFETPRKQMAQIKEFTPPEELFSPKAGYDSVFKSRPKIGFSPVGSPSPGASPSVEV